MANNFTEMIHTDETVDYVSPVWSHIAFGLFLFGLLVSIPCYFFVMYHLLAEKVARKVLHNHAIIVMLIYNFIIITIDMTMTLSFIQLGYVSLLTPARCLTQQFVDYGIWYGALFLMLWISIERHILVFHSVLVSTARGRLFFHYIPLVIFSLYAPILYFYLVFVLPYKRIDSGRENFCGGPYFYNALGGWFIWYESFINYIIPILLIVVFSVSLIIRVIVQKRRLQQAVAWRRHRKMILQLVFISIIYLVFDLPYAIISIVQWAGIPNFGDNILSPYISHLTYVPAIIIPYATLVTLSELKQKLRVFIFWKANQRAIAPLILIKRF